MTWPDSSCEQSEYQGVCAVPTSGEVHLDHPEGARGKIGCCATCAGKIGRAHV